MATLAWGCQAVVSDAPAAQQEEREVDSARAIEATDASEETWGAQGDAWFCNEQVLDLLKDAKYRGAGFRLVNAQPFPSTAAPGKTITLWVSEQGYDSLSKVSPERSGSKVELPVGTVIVREVLRDSAIDALTVMVKMAPGSFPLGGDYWYAATDADGTVRNDAQTGAPVIGLLKNCGTCHLRRSDDDFLFGAPDGYVH